MRSSSILPTLAALLLVLPAGARKGQAQAPAPATPAPATLLSAVPRDATMVLQATSIRSALDKLRQSPAAGLQDHPAIKALVERVRSRLSAGAADAQKELGFDPLDVLLSLDGEWVFCLGNLESLAGPVGEGLSIGQPPEVAPEQVPFVVAASAGAAAPRVREAFAKLFAYAEKQGASRSTRELKGATITSITEGGAARPGASGSEEKPAGKDAEKGSPPEKDKEAKKDSGVARPQEAEEPEADKADKDGENDAAEEQPTDEAAPPGSAVHFAEKDGRFYISPSRSFLELCLGGGEAVLALGPFQESRAAAGTGDALFYLNVKQLTESVSSALSSTLFAFFWQKANALLFGKSFHNMLVNVSLEPKGVRETYFINNAGAADGILGVFKGDAYAPQPPAFLPADTKSFATTAFNPEALGRTIKDVAQTIMAFRGQGTDVDLFFDKLIGVRLTELVAGLGRRAAYWQSAPAPGQVAGSNLCLLLELRDPAPILKVLKKFSGGPGAALEVSKHKDRDLYSLMGGGARVAVTLLDKQLLVGLADEVKRSLDLQGAGQPGLGDTAEFKAVLASVPKEVGSFSYASPDYFKATLTALAGAAKDSADEDGALVIDALLALADYCGTSYGYALWKEKGIFGDVWLHYRKP